MLQGILPINKPQNVTSHDVVNRVRRILGIRRVGHTGTLDPIATGVLVLCVGEATRLAEFLSVHDKVYRTRIRLGITTDTLDRTGSVVSTTDASHLMREDVSRVLPSFTGCIKQVPPMISARRHQGTRLYTLARAGYEVPREAREVSIARLDLLAFEPGAHPAVDLEVACSAGTYIRSLAADLGAALGVGGMMEELVRTRVGAVKLEDCCTLEEVQEAKASGRLGELLHTATWVMGDWPRITVTPREAELLRYGRPLLRSVTDKDLPQGLVLVLDGNGGIVAVARSDGREVRPTKVFGVDSGA